jgi:hypothetical protein
MKTSARKKANTPKTQQRAKARSARAKRVLGSPLPENVVGRWYRKEKEHKGVPLPKASHKKWKLEDLLARITAMVEKESTNPHGQRHLTVEGVAGELKAKIPLVNKCFIILNQRGLLEQAQHRRPDPGNWMSNYYAVRRP